MSSSKCCKDAYRAASGLSAVNLFIQWTDPTTASRKYNLEIAYLPMMASSAVVIQRHQQKQDIFAYPFKRSL